MTAPDPGLTDLIAAALGDKLMHTNGSGDRNRAYAAHVALVVEQHTNGRIAEENEILRNDVFEAENERKGWTTRALTAEATVTRVRALTLLNGRPGFGAIPVIDLYTALEGAS